MSIKNIVYDELSTYKKNKLNEFIKDIKSMGDEEIGVGSFASVYKFGRGSVIRVESKGTGFYSGYKDWVEKIVLSSRSRHVPKIFFHGYTKYKMITVVEKLHPWPDVHDYSYPISEILEGTWDTTLPKITKVKLNRGNLVSLRKAAEKKKLTLDDAGYSNLMLRKSDNRIVITDPIYSAID